MAHHIREEMKSEERLRQSEERFSRVFQSCPMAITISTMEQGRYLDINDAFLQMIGRRRDEVVGHTSRELHIWDDFQDRDKLVEELGQRGRVASLETVFVAKSGVRRTVQVAAELFLLDEVPCVLAITNDVTDAKALEDQLRQAQKMDAVGRLAGGIAHDFNNMVGVIIGYCDVADSRSDIERIRRDVLHIKKAAQRAAALTRQLLTFSRQQVLRPAVLNLNTAFNDLLQMLSRVIPANIKLQYHTDPALGNIRADPGQIEQIIMNLVVNARDATPGEGKIIIETSNVHLDEVFTKGHPGVQPGSYVMLSVSDTGCGMDVQTLSRIFEPFFTTKSPGEGTGLGLSMLYGAMQQAGGHVDVYSEQGTGTVFKLYFPRIDASGVPHHPLNRETTFVRGSETILLVEDESEFREITREMLEGAGYKVLTAGDGRTAISHAEKFTDRIDALVTDVVLPGMSGRDMTQRISKSRPDLKVLYMSGYPGNFMVSQNLVEERASLLEKPFTQEALLSQLRTVLNGQHALSRACW